MPDRTPAHGTGWHRRPALGARAVGGSPCPAPPTGGGWLHPAAEMRVRAVTRATDAEADSAPPRGFYGQGGAGGDALGPPAGGGLKQAFRRIFLPLTPP